MCFCGVKSLWLLRQWISPSMVRPFSWSLSLSGIYCSSGITQLKKRWSGDFISSCKGLFTKILCHIHSLSDNILSLSMQLQFSKEILVSECFHSWRIFLGCFLSRHGHIAWKPHNIQTLSALPVMRVVGVFVGNSLHKLLKKQWSWWWFETPSHSCELTVMGLRTYDECK